MDGIPQAADEQHKVRPLMNIVAQLENYKSLVDFENKITGIIQKKQLDTQIASFKCAKRKKRLQFYISQVIDEENKTVCLYLEGRIQNNPQRRSMTDFLKSVIFEISTPTDTFIKEWNSERTKMNTNVISVKIKLMSDINVRILIKKKTSVYKLTNELAATLSQENGTREAVQYAIWKYIKVNKLKEDKDNRIVCLDSNLQKVFETDKISYSDLTEQIKHNLIPIEPEEIHYKIEYNKDCFVNNIQYETDVEINDPLKQEPIGTSVSMVKEMVSYNMRIQDLLEEVEKLEEKRIFLNSFIENPIKEINNWIRDQSKDISNTLGEIDYQNNEIFEDSKIMKDLITLFLSQK
eukprot:GHVP01021695.1.p1 GENE.GHVP01021695.1~~GHVP01021695.1.p1  ORF type:complete len:350 (+),score=65.18 GHVP01021695.1:3-1052(+)